MIGRNRDRILVDTGEDFSSKQYTAFLLDSVFPSTGTSNLSAIILTHGHKDHQGGVVSLLKELENRKMFPLPKIYKKFIVNGKYPANNFECHHIVDKQLFVLDKDDDDARCTLEAIYTPGHTDDHICLILYEDNAILSGDCVLGCGSTVFDDLHQYMQSLVILENFLLTNRKVVNIYPGHGPVIKGTALAKVQQYISHRGQRESQVLSALSSSDGDGPWTTSWDLVNGVYKGFPLILRIAAHNGVSQHLQKLRVEGRVERRFPDLWRRR